MKKTSLTKALLFGSILFSQSGWAAEEQFHLSAKDGVSLAGQIDFPASSQVRGVILLVPGTGLFDRDANFGQTNTEKDLIFREISKSLTENHFAVVRFDYRGVKCNQLTAPPCPECKDKRELHAYFAKKCIDNNIRAGVTPENIRSDIETMYQYIATHQKLINMKILVFGHSEGSLNLSYLIAENRIHPTGAVFMGGLAESPQSVIRWQIIDRLATALFEFDFNSDGIVGNEEIKLGHSKKLNYLHQLPIEVLFSPSGFWTIETINAHLEDSYQAMKTEALSHADNEPFGANGLIQASYRWWKMFFTDSQSVIGNLTGFKGPIFYLNGSIDAQTDFTRQTAEIERFTDQFSWKPEIVKAEGTGHALGQDPIFGPLLPSSLELIVNTCIKAIGQSY